MESLSSQFNKLSTEEQMKFIQNNNKFLRGKVAMITGGNAGIGKQAVDIFANAGAKVAFNSSSNPDLGNQVAKEASEKFGVECIYTQCDVRDSKAIDDWMAATVEKLGEVDILVNNAGRAYITPLEYMSKQDFDDCISINLTAPFLLMQKVIPHMKKKKWGRIVNISSGTTQTTQAYLSAYMAAKNGLNSLTRGLSKEVGEDGITVNSILPGCTDTEMYNKGVELYAQNLGKSTEEAKMLTISNHAIKRPVIPKNVAELALYLMTEKAACITGSSIACDCGFTL